eukprot:Blabericola_migrator_1__3972@NODE_2201_length_3137_cov_57_500000_g1386_i0_p3_GENE_NODE_2201_length_3137_cov_57_500000_g1386_i0NODE_2201_length_3137_cov_57_500000_g1386_i0_p3_ORF_typecomplete_len202_score39_23CGI121/PF08617_10/2_1e11_NODE_2201_length_3137_cov_57_500000_g1386_i024003005
MKASNLGPEFPGLELRLFHYKAQGDGDWEVLKNEVSHIGDFDIAHGVDPLEKIEVQSLPFIFSYNKIASWRVVQAAVLSALSSIKTGNKRIKSFKSDVIYRLAPGWSVADIRTKLSPETVDDELLVVWVCVASAEVAALHQDLIALFEKHHFVLSRQPTSSFEVRDQGSNVIKQLYHLTDNEMRNGGMELAVLQRCAIKDI